MSELEIPQGWSIKKLDELSTVERGINWTKSSESKIPSKNSIPVLRIGNVRERMLDLSNVLYLNDIPSKQISKHKVSKNDILLVASNGNKKMVGRSCIINKNMNFVYASFLMGIKEISNEIEPSFLFYYLNSPTGWNFIRNSTHSGVGINNLRITKLRDSSVIFPRDKNLQKKIIQKLDHIFKQFEEKRKIIFEFIEKNNSTINYLISNYHRIIMLSQIPQTNFPKNWNIKKLGEIAILGAGGTPSRPKSDYWEGDIPWLRSGELRDKKIFDSNEKITKLGLKNSSTKLLPKKTILIAMTGQGLTRGKTGFLEIESCANQSCAHIIIDDDKVLSEYVWMYLQSQYWNFRKIQHGSGQPGINVSLIKQFEIPIPSLEEQKRILNNIKILDLSSKKIKTNLEVIIENNKNTINSLTNLRNSVLNAAFSGKLFPKRS